MTELGRYQMVERFNYTYLLLFVYKRVLSYSQQISKIKILENSLDNYRTFYFVWLHGGQRLSASKL